jgi:hypothetical protein
MHQPIVVLSHRQGIVFKLCKEVGWVVEDEWGFNKLHLRVESSNNVVRALYEKHLNYRLEWFEKGAMALYADLSARNFIECTSDTLTLVEYDGCGNKQFSPLVTQKYYNN